MEITEKNDTIEELPLIEQIEMQSEAMAKYSFANGLKVPPQIIQSLNAIITRESQRKLIASDKSAPDNLSTLKLRKSYAEEINELVAIHDQLAEIVSPAKPGTILLLNIEAQKAGMWAFLGPVALIRRLMLAALISLAGVIFIGLSPDINVNTMSIFTSEGIPLLVNLLFRLSAAGVGASFAALFMANKYISSGTYDPKFESSYWIKFVVGLIAGIILSELIPLGANNSLGELAKPTLAMLGGFSANVVYKILNRLIEAVESLVSGNAADAIANKQSALQQKYTEQLNQAKFKTASSLVNFQKELGDNIPDNLKEKLNAIIEEVIPVKEYASKKLYTQNESDNSAGNVSPAAN